MNAPAPARPGVIKFGGRALERDREVADHLARAARRNPSLVVVASARGATTDWLEEILARPGDRRGHAERLERIRALHPDLGGAGRRHLATLRRLVAALERRGRADPAAADRLRAMGERLSVHQLASVLASEGLPAVPIEADRLGLCTDGRFGAATLRWEASAESVRTGLRRVLARGGWPIVTGYFGRAPGGGPAVLGRGGSDYTATGLGYLLGAGRVDLVKPGGAIRSGDPLRVGATRAVPRLSYDEAEELAQFGAKVLHPLCVGPARWGRLDLRVGGLDRPAEATRIGPRAAPPGVFVVSELAPFRSLEVPVAGGRQRPGGLAGLARRLAATGVPAVALFASASQLTLLVPPSEARRVLRALQDRRTREDRPRLLPGTRSLVGVVGRRAVEQLPRLPGGALRAVEQLGATASSLALVVRSAAAGRVLRTLHRSLVAGLGPRAEPS